MISCTSFMILAGAYFFIILFSVLTLCSIRVFSGKIKWLFRTFIALSIVNASIGLGIYAELVYTKSTVDGNILRLIVDYVNALMVVVTLVAIRATAAIARNQLLSGTCTNTCTNYRKVDEAENSVFDLRHLDDKGTDENH